MKKLICKLFGHKYFLSKYEQITFDERKLLVNNKMYILNKMKIPAKYTCSRCGEDKPDWRGSIEELVKL